MNKPFIGLDKKLESTLTKHQRFIRRCPEYQKNPELGEVIFKVTKEHPCSCCNRPLECKVLIK